MFGQMHDSSKKHSSNARWYTCLWCAAEELLIDQAFIDLCDCATPPKKKKGFKKV